LLNVEDLEKPVDTVEPIIALTRSEVRGRRGRRRALTR